MADAPEITRNLIEMYGRNDLVMRMNFHAFMRISGLTAIGRDSRILDVGCAMGHLILMLQSYGFNNLIGLDASPEMAALAEKNTKARIILSDATEIEKHVEPSSIDAVIVSDLIHHLKNVSEWEKLFSGCGFALKKGGRLIIREPHPTLPLRLLYRMSRHGIFHVGFLKSRLQSFIDEDELLQYYFNAWPKDGINLLLKNGFKISRKVDWIVHRITTCVNTKEK